MGEAFARCSPTRPPRWRRRRLRGARRGLFRSGGEPVARLLAGVDVAPIDDLLGRRAGTVLARSGRSDAIDASVVCLARDGDDILTSDPGDLRDLAQAAGIHVELIPV